MRNWVLFFFLLGLANSLAQPLEVTWGPDNVRKSTLMEILPDQGENFYAFRMGKGALMQVPKVTRYIDGQEVVSKKIDQRVGNSTVLLEQLISFNGQLVGFLSDKKGGLNSLYMVKYDTEIDPYGEATEIANYSMPRTVNNRGSFNVTVSNNRKFCCVEYMIPGKRNEFDRFGYKVIDSSYQTISEGEFEIPYASRLTSVDARHLTNSGQYVIGVSVFTGPDFGVWRDYSAIQKTLIVHVQKDTIQQYQLDVAQRRVFNFDINSIDSFLIVTGTFGATFAPGAQGVFFQRINLQARKVEVESFRDFPSDFLAEEYSFENTMRFERRDNVNRFGNELMNYAFRGIHPQADGSVLVVAEQFYIYQQSTTDARGLSQTINHYYYNDIVMYRIDVKGEFKWIEKIPKEQHSTNDFGYYSSVKTFVHQDKLVCVFNDHAKSYDEFGLYNGIIRTVNFPIRKKYYVLANAEVNVDNGKIERRILNNYEQINGFVAIKSSSIDLRTNQVIFFATARKERFGFLQF